jgi:hypothetical protein
VWDYGALALLLALDADEDALEAIAPSGGGGALTSGAPIMAPQGAPYSAPYQLRIDCRRGNLSDVEVARRLTHTHALVGLHASGLCDARVSPNQAGAMA